MPSGSTRRPLASWLDRSIADPQGRAFVLAIAESLFVRTAGEVSTLDFLFHARTAGSWRRRWASRAAPSRSGSSVDPRRWPGTWPTTLARLWCWGRRFGGSSTAATASAFMTHARTFAARRAIVALPPTLAGRIAFEPALPAARDGLAQRMAHGSVIKVQVVYPEPFWRADGLSGISFSADGGVGLTSDNSPASGAPGVIVGFIDGTEARRMSPAPPRQRRAFVLDSLARRFGRAALQPIAYHELDGRWSRGRGAATRVTWCPAHGSRSDRRSSSRAARFTGPGTETAFRMAGYIDGAIESGLRAAAEVHAALGSPSRRPRRRSRAPRPGLRSRRRPRATTETVSMPGSQPWAYFPRTNGFVGSIDRNSRVTPCDVNRTSAGHGSARPNDASDSCPFGKVAMPSSTSSGPVRSMATLRRGIRSGAWPPPPRWDRSTARVMPLPACRSRRRSGCAPGRTGRVLARGLPCRCTPRTTEVEPEVEPSTSATSNWKISPPPLVV